MSAFGWTVVQHSGYGYGGKEGFKHGVEVRSLSSKKEHDLVEKVGGITFATYHDASLFEERANFPPGHGDIYPRVQGTFSSYKVDDLAIYIPVRDAIG